MKYVILDYEGKWKNDVFRMFYHMTNYFVEHLGYEMIDSTNFNSTNKLSLSSLSSKDSNQKCADDFLVIENHDGKLVIDFISDLDFLCLSDNINNKQEERKTEEGLKEKKVNFYLLSDDIHKEKERKKATSYYRLFTKIFVTYYNPFFELYPELTDIKDRIVWTPHCVSELMISKFNNKPVAKIGLLGNTAKNVYPNRAFIKDLQNNEVFRDIICEKAHPSKKYKPVNYEKNKIVGQGFYDTLNQYLCNATCSLTLGYIVCKYFEIAYTGSLLLADPSHDDLSKLGFVDMETCVLYKNQSEIPEKILWILDPKNREQVDKIRKAGFELIRERHMIPRRCQEIDNLLTK